MGVEIGSGFRGHWDGFPGMMCDVTQVGGVVMAQGDVGAAVDALLGQR